MGDRRAAALMLTTLQKAVAWSQTQRLLERVGGLAEELLRLLVFVLGSVRIGLSVEADTQVVVGVRTHLGRGWRSSGQLQRVAGAGCIARLHQGQAPVEMHPAFRRQFARSPIIRSQCGFAVPRGELLVAFCHVFVFRAQPLPRLGLRRARGPEPEHQAHRKRRDVEVRTHAGLFLRGFQASGSKDSSTISTNASNRTSA